MGTLTGTAYAAARWLEESEAAHQLLLRHSLGGAAAVAAAGELSGIEAVFTIAAPSDPSHVRHLLGQGVAEAAGDEPVDVLLAGRKFQVRKQLLDDLSAVHLEPIVESLRCATLLLH